MAVLLLERLHARISDKGHVILHLLLCAERQVVSPLTTSWVCGADAEGTTIKVLTHFGSIKVRNNLLTVRTAEQVYRLLVDYSIIPSSVPDDGSTVSFSVIGNSTEVPNDRRGWGLLARGAMTAGRTSSAAGRSSSSWNSFWDAGSKASTAYYDTGYQAYRDARTGRW
jgi:hypothetical protein